MASTPTSTQADPQFDGGGAPTVAEGRFTGVEEALARLAHRAASDAPDARPSGPPSDRPADADIPRSFAAATLGGADVRAPAPREPQPQGKRGTLAWVAIAVCLGASSIWAWQLYGGPARDMVATWAPSGWISAHPSAEQTPPTRDPAPEQAVAPAAVETSTPPPAQAASQAASAAQPATTSANETAADSADHQQIETMTRDLAALRQTVEQLSAGQEQLTRELAKLQSEKAQAEKPPADKPEKRMPHRASAPPAPSVAARKPPIAPTPPTVSMPPQAASQVSTVSPPSPPPQPAPQIQSQPQPSDPAPLRPPAPVPQP